MEKKFDIKLFLVLIFLGWFGIDKLLFKDWKMFLAKFFSLFIFIGLLWNVYDLIMCCLKKYETNPFKI